MEAIIWKDKTVTYRNKDKKVVTKKLKIELIKGLKTSNDYLEKLYFQQKMYKDCILSHNYVISVGAYTICTKLKDGKKMLDYRFNELPSLWTKDGAESNKKALQVNDDREINITGKHTWYVDEIKRVNLMIDSVEKILNNNK